MLDLAIIILLIMGFFIGLKRGFILQIIHIVGFVIAFIVAHMYFEKLAPKLTLWVPYPNLQSNSTIRMLFDQTNLEDAYYRAIAFVVIFFAVKIVLHMIGSMLDFVANFPILKPLNIWAGGILGFVEIYLIIFILLYIAALVPVDIIQNALNNSFMAKGIVENTPVISNLIKEMWIEYIAS
ncbi:CvpA family protein [Cytobacillus depressus]|uniref:CvpA family protein n=1 Tax=Cytobacillus depressus TaxID=1602942 RepID=A0A6L3VAT1_9BACI|nr:CvpA family protein [Cytobacillus depressus]KAB2338776.1 CvpA family protein [Cytobacillus depressus]